MKSLPELQNRAAALLELKPSPLAAARLLRHVLGAGLDDERLREVSEQIRSSIHVRLLAGEQRIDGGWGAFHSRSASSKRKIPSTEFGVERALALGLSPKHTILAKAGDYILSIMLGKRPFPDLHEKNDRWPTGMRMFLAATLSLIDPRHPVLEDDRALWAKIARRTFHSGMYSEHDEIQAHASLTGATVKDSYLVINNRYALNILGSAPNLLPAEIEEALLSWLWQHERGIRYLEMPLSGPPPLSRPGPLDRWFASMELMVRSFPRAAARIAPWLEWIWERQDGDGLWDFGPRPAYSTFLPLADTWRKPIQRRIDWSTRVLLLSATYVEAEHALDTRSGYPGGQK